MPDHLSHAAGTLKDPPEQECQYCQHSQKDQCGAEIVLRFRLFFFPGGFFYLFQLLNSNIRILKRSFPVHFTLEVLHPFPAQSKQIPVFLIAIRKTGICLLCAGNG